MCLYMPHTVFISSLCKWKGQKDCIFVVLYAVRNAKIGLYAVRKPKMKQYAVSNQGRGFNLIVYTSYCKTTGYM